MTAGLAATRALHDAQSAFAAGRFHLAHAHARRAHRGLVATRGRAHPDVAVALIVRTRIEIELGNLAGAERIARRALAIAPRELRLVATIHLASIHYERGDYPRSRSLYVRAARLAAPDSRELGIIENALGMLGKAQGRYDDAAAHYAIAYRILTTTGPIGELAAVYHNLGGLDHARGRYAEGEAWARHGLALRERELGADHPIVAKDVAALASLVDAQGRDDDAQLLYRRALAVFRHTYGAEHYEIAVNLNNLGALDVRRGRLASASRILRRALEMKERVLGANHVDVAITRHNLAVCLSRRGNHARARALDVEALRVMRTALGARHPFTRRVAAQIATVQ